MTPAAPVQHGSTSGAEASSFAAQQLPGAIMQQHAHAHAMSVKMGGNFAMHSQSGPPSLDFTVKGKQTSTGKHSHGHGRPFSLGGGLLADASGHRGAPSPAGRMGSGSRGSRLVGSQAATAGMRYK